MNALELVRRTARECGMTNSDSVPASLSGLQGNLLNAYDWVKDAWRELQRSEPYWLWMRSRFSLNTIPGQDSYAPTDCIDLRANQPISRFASWLISDRRNPPKAYLTSGGVGGQYFLTWLEWDDFCVLYRIGTYAPAMPAHITIDPNENIVLGPTPNDDYTIVGEYQRSAQELTGDDDVPEMPPDFHMIIVYDAMRKYALSEAAQEILARADVEGGSLKASLRHNQLPKFRRAPPLA